MARQNRFRNDLLDRLAFDVITLPPLRSREGDIPLLADHFALRMIKELGREYFPGFSEEAAQGLREYSWPGNVRELKNVVERAVVLARTDQVDVSDLKLSNLGTVSDSVELPAHIVSGDASQFEAMTLAQLEQRQILATLDNFKWNKSRTAKTLGIERSTLDRKIRRYNLEQKN